MLCAVPQQCPDVTVLLMDNTGAVGLDLSFASHVFLMEPLEDASLEEQVIARAHRMGASATVQVETLVMRVRRSLDYNPCIISPSACAWGTSATVQVEALVMRVRV
jgi:hypothetical protein